MYYFLLAGLLISSPLVKKNVHAVNRTYSGKFLYCLFWMIVMIVLVGFRSLEIGNDTQAYAYIFNSMSRTDSFSEWLANNRYTSGVDNGYYLMCFLLSRFMTYRTFMIISAIVTIAPAAYIIYKLSDSVLFSFVLYICFPYYTLTMSMMRQAYAIAFIMIAFYCCVKKKLLGYLILYSIAVSFHQSAILFLPVYWIAKIKNTVTTRSVAVFGIAFCFIFRRQLFDIALLFARMDYSGTEASGFRMSIFLILSAILGCLYYAKVYYRSNDEKLPMAEVEKTLLYLQILAAAISPLTFQNPALARMYYYYHIFALVFIPNMCKSIQNKLIRTIVVCGYVLAALYFLVSIVQDPSQHYFPYHFM